MKGEVARAEAHRQVFHLEERPRQIDQAALEMPHMGALVDHQPLDLMEHGRMGHVVVAAIGAARCDDPVRRRLGLHRPDLHRRGVGPEQHALAPLVGAEIESVVHLARRVLRRDVERREIVEVVLDVRPFDDPEAHVGENRDQLIQHLADRVNGAVAFGRGGSVTSTRAVARRWSKAVRSSAARRASRASASLRLIWLSRAPASLRASISSRRGLHRLRERRFLAERRDAGLL